MLKMLVGCLVLTLLPNLAGAQDAARLRLSDQGRTLLAGSVGGYIANYASGKRERGELEWEVDLAPSFAHFFWQRIALGAYGSYGHHHYQLATPPASIGLNAIREDVLADVDRFSAGVQGLAELVLSPRLGLFVWITGGYVRERARLRVLPSFASSGERATRYEETAHAIEASMFVPLALHLSDSVVLGFGPRLQWRGYAGREDNPYRGIMAVRFGAGSWIGASF